MIEINNKTLKFILIFILLFLGSLLIFISAILFKGEAFYIKAFESKNYFLLNVYLKINPKLVETNIVEDTPSFDRAIVVNDIKLLEILSKYMHKFNKKVTGVRVLNFVTETVGGEEILEFILKKDLIKSNAEFEDTYNDYLNQLLFHSHDLKIIGPVLHGKPSCGKILIKYGADPYYFDNQQYRRFPCIIENPEYLEDCYSLVGLNAFIKLKKLIVNFRSINDRMLKKENIERLIVVLETFEIKELKKDDIAYIKELKRYLKEDFKDTN